MAAALTYYAVLAIFPALLALVSLLGVVGQAGKTVDTALEVIRRRRAASMDTTREPVLDMAKRTAAGLDLGGRAARRAVVGLRVRRCVRPRR